MTTFVDAVLATGNGDAAELGRLLSERLETLDEAVDVLEAWTDESRRTRAQLASEYDAAKRRARTEIREAGDADAAELPAAELLDHPAVTDRTKRRLREYSTKLFVHVDEEDAYGTARAELLRALGAELDLYRRLLPELDGGETSAEDARQQIARFAREETLGPANATAADVILDAAIDG